MDKVERFIKGELNRIPTIVNNQVKFKKKLISTDVDSKPLSRQKTSLYPLSYKNVINFFD